MNAPASPCLHLIQFDDAFSCVYDIVFPIMAAAGMVGTVFAALDLVGATGYMTEAQLQEMYAAGWDVGNHTSVHAPLSDQNLATQRARLAAGATWLDGLGLTRASRHVAYPQGQYNADTLTAMAAEGMLSGRTVSGSGEDINAIAWYEMKGLYGISKVHSPAAAAARLDLAAWNEVIIWWTHIISAEPAALDWETAEFQAFIDDLVASGVQPITISQLYDYVQRGYTTW